MGCSPPFGRCFRVLAFTRSVTAKLCLVHVSATGETALTKRSRLLRAGLIATCGVALALSATSAFANPASSSPTQAAPNTEPTGRPSTIEKQAAGPITVSGTIYAETATPASVLAGASVQICPRRGEGTWTNNARAEMDDVGAGDCESTTSDAQGTYSFDDLMPDEYWVQAYPPASSTAEPASRLVELINVDLSGQDLVLNVPTPLPAGTTITNIGLNPQGVPTVYWGDPLTLTTQGCEGAVATWQLMLDGVVKRSGELTEGADGQYSTTIDPLQPDHGHGTFSIHLECPSGPAEDVTFDVYIDPSGHVIDTDGNPIQGAQVTLYRSDTFDGPFTVVPDGSAIMSPSNRKNPLITTANGYFGWDVVAGYYQVRATHAGCVSADDPSLPYAQSYTMTIPPPVTDLSLVLSCTNHPPAAVPFEFTVAEDSIYPINLDYFVGQSVKDPDGDPVTLVSVTMPSHGGLFCTTPLGICTYVPAPDFNGEEAFTYTVSDGKGGTATDTVTMHVTPVNDLPTAAFTIDPPSGDAPLSVKFDGNGSVDVEGIAAYAWDFGDGQSGTGAVVPHTYAKAGTYTAKLTVTDTDGAKASTSETITVKATQPPAMRDTLSLDRSGTQTYHFGGELDSGDYVFGYKKGKLASIDGTGVLAGKKVAFDLRASKNGRAHGRITVADAKTGKILDRIRVRGTYPTVTGLTIEGTSIWGKNGQKLERVLWSVTDVPSKS